MSLIRQDAQGLFVRTGGYVFRPGGQSGRHAVDIAAYRVTTQSTHTAGEHVKARHISGTPIANVGEEVWIK